MKNNTALMVIDAQVGPLKSDDPHALAWLCDASQGIPCQIRRTQICPDVREVSDPRGDPLADPDTTRMSGQHHRLTSSMSRCARWLVVVPKAPAYGRPGQSAAVNW